MELAGLPDHVREPDPSIYWSGNYVTLDFETTTKLKGSPLASGNRIVLACWSNHDVGAKRLQHEEQLPSSERTDRVRSRFAFANEYGLDELVQDISRAKFIVAHNAKFELGWLRRCGVDLRDIIVFDTMTADYVLGGNEFNLQHLSLDKCLARHGLEPKKNLVGLMIKGKVPVEDIPQSWLLNYCQRDVSATGELFLKQRAALKAKGLEAVNYQRNLVTPALADIEFNGMQLDCEEVLKYEEEKELEYTRLSADFQRFCDGANPASAKQMQEFIYGTLGFKVPTDHRRQPLLTPSGNPSVAAPVMEKLVATTARQSAFVDLHSKWGRIHSDLSKYIRKFGDCVRVAGGSLHAAFNQCATRTHRLSSSGLEFKVQFQNFSRAFKPYFRARNRGWLVGEIDGAQLEFRVAAHLGHDKVALGDIVSGADIHMYTASIIGCTRQEAKAHTFKPLYGGMSGDTKEREYYEAFKRKYKGIADTQDGWVHSVLRDKTLTTEWGLIYSWPDTKMSKSGYITNTTSIYNYPVQALATAEIIPVALVAAWHRMKGIQSFLVNTVHDSIIAEIHPAEVGLWHDVARKSMIEDVYIIINKLYGVELTVPLGAGVCVGTHWGSDETKATEVVYTAPDNLWIDAATKEGMI